MEKKSLKKFKLNKAALKDFDGLLSQHLDEVEDLTVTELDTKNKILNIISLCLNVKILTIDANTRTDTSAILNSLCKPEKLTMLILKNVKLPDSQAMERYKNLKFISLHNVGFTSIKSFIDTIKNPKKIEGISLKDVDFAGENFDILSVFENVKIVTINNMKNVQFTELEFFDKAKKLEKIIFKNSRIESEGIEYLLRGSYEKDIALEVKSIARCKVKDSLVFNEDGSSVSVHINNIINVIDLVNDRIIDECNLIIDSKDIIKENLELLKDFEGHLNIYVRDFSNISQEELDLLENELYINTIHFINVENTYFYKQKYLDYSLKDFREVRVALDELVSRVKDEKTESLRVINLIDIILHDIKLDDAFKATTADITDLKNVFKEKLATSETYIELIHSALSILGLDSVIIKGDEDYIWEQVKIDGKWYNIDLGKCAYDKAISINDACRYLLSAEDIFNEDHSTKTKDKHLAHESIDQELLKGILKNGKVKIGNEVIESRLKVEQHEEKIEAKEKAKKDFSNKIKKAFGINSKEEQEEATPETVVEEKEPEVIESKVEETIVQETAPVAEEEKLVNEQVEVDAEESTEESDGSLLDAIDELDDVENNAEQEENATQEVAEVKEEEKPEQVQEEQALIVPEKKPKEKVGLVSKIFGLFGNKKSKVKEEIEEVKEEIETIQEEPKEEVVATQEEVITSEEEVVEQVEEQPNEEASKEQEVLTKEVELEDLEQEIQEAVVDNRRKIRLSHKVFTVVKPKKKRKIRLSHAIYKMPVKEDTRRKIRLSHKVFTVVKPKKKRTLKLSHAIYKMPVKDTRRKLRLSHKVFVVIAPKPKKTLRLSHAVYTMPVKVDPRRKLKLASFRYLRLYKTKEQALKVREKMFESIDNLLTVFEEPKEEEIIVEAEVDTRRKLRLAKNNKSYVKHNVESVADILQDVDFEFNEMLTRPKKKTLRLSRATIIITPPKKKRRIRLSHAVYTMPVKVDTRRKLRIASYSYVKLYKTKEQALRVRNNLFASIDGILTMFEEPKVEEETIVEAEAKVDTRRKVKLSRANNIHLIKIDYKAREERLRREEQELIASLKEKLENQDRIISELQDKVLNTQNQIEAVQEKQSEEAPQEVIEEVEMPQIEEEMIKLPVEETVEEGKVIEQEEQATLSVEEIAEEQKELAEKELNIIAETTTQMIETESTLVEEAKSNGEDIVKEEPKLEKKKKLTKKEKKALNRAKKRMAYEELKNASLATKLEEKVEIMSENIEKEEQTNNINIVSNEETIKEPIEVVSSEPTMVKKNENFMSDKEASLENDFIEKLEKKFANKFNDINLDKYNNFIKKYDLDAELKNDELAKTKASSVKETVEKKSSVEEVKVEAKVEEEKSKDVLYDDDDLEKDMHLFDEKEPETSIAKYSPFRSKIEQIKSLFMRTNKVANKNRRDNSEN